MSTTIAHTIIPDNLCIDEFCRRSARWSVTMVRYARWGPGEILTQRYSHKVLKCAQGQQRWSAGLKAETAYKKHLCTPYDCLPLALEALVLASKTSEKAGKSASLIDSWLGVATGLLSFDSRSHPNQHESEGVSHCHPGPCTPRHRFPPAPPRQSLDRQEKRHCYKYTRMSSAAKCHRHSLWRGG